MWLPFFSHLIPHSGLDKNALKFIFFLFCVDIHVCLSLFFFDETDRNTIYRPQFIQITIALKWFVETINHVIINLNNYSRNPILNKLLIISLIWNYLFTITSPLKFIIFNQQIIIIPINLEYRCLLPVLTIIKYLTIIQNSFVLTSSLNWNSMYPLE